jgi:CHAD domain-containing protein
MHQSEGNSNGTPGGESPTGSAPSYEYVPPKITPGDPAALAIQAAIALGYHRLRTCDPAARVGVVVGVHRLRTSTRRLRSELRTFEGLIDAAWAERLEVELKWLAGALGAVRDLDVLRDRLTEAAGDDRDVLGPLFRSIDDRHAQATEALRDVLQSDRYHTLIDTVADAVGGLALRDEAWERCRSALPPLGARAWKRLKTSACALGPDDPDEDFHEVRKRAKRARYAAEAVAPALGAKRAGLIQQFARRATRVQDVLGEHQDAIVAAETIRHVVAEHPDDAPFSLAAGRLLEREEEAARDARADFFKVWDRLDRKKYVRWMKT